MFAAAARERVAAAGLGRLVEVHEADGAEFLLEPESYDAALCLGASFVWGFAGDAAAALAPAVLPGGHVAIGAPHRIYVREERERLGWAILVGRKP